MVLVFFILNTHTCSSQIIQPTPKIPKVKLWGMGMPNRTFTFSNFENIKNSNTPPGTFDATSSTVLIRGYSSNVLDCDYATWFLDIGDNDGNVGKQPFRIVVAYLDQSGTFSYYKRVEVYDDTRLHPITTSLGRTDGKACYGPGGKIYFTTYSPYNSTVSGYLIEFDPNELVATAYAFPPKMTSPYDFGSPYIAASGPTPDANNPTTLIYGSTFNGTRVWWFNPSALNKHIEYVSYGSGVTTTYPEVDPRQNYVDEIAGKGNWVYLLMNRRGIEVPAYKSVYAVNIVTKNKYLLFHSTQSNFHLRQAKDPLNNENIVMLQMDHGMAPGTIYTDPKEIPMNTAYPAGVGSNCPCYNITPDAALPPSINNLITATPYNTNPFRSYYTSGTTNVPNTPNEFTKFCYNQNYALPRIPFGNGTSTILDPPGAICDKTVDNGPYFNLPWDLIPNFPAVPNTTTWYSFKISGKIVNTTNPIEGNLNYWNSYDPFYPQYITNANSLPNTRWDEEENKLYYKFPNSSTVYELNIYPDTYDPINGLRSYDVDLGGLAMTAPHGQNTPFGVPKTLLKGVRKEGFAEIKYRPGFPLDYEIEFKEKLKNDESDFLTVAEDYVGHEFATNILAGYPGGVDVYNANKPSNYSMQCVVNNNTLACNPRRICNIGGLRKTIVTASGNSITKYGPETPVGARLYSPDYYQPLPGNTGPIRYRIVTAGVPNRGRQDDDVAIGIQDFTVNQDPTNTVNTVTLTSSDVVDYNDGPDKSFLKDFHAYCIANQPIDNMQQCQDQGTNDLRYINSPYNDGVGHFSNLTGWACPSRPLGMVLSVRSTIPGEKYNELLCFDTDSKTIYNRIPIPEQFNDIEPLTNLITIGDRLIAKAKYKEPNTGINKPVIITFKLGDGEIEPGSLLMYYNPYISDIHKFFVTQGSEYQNGNGNIWKIFLQYKNNVSSIKIGNIDINKTGVRATSLIYTYFTQLIEYEYNYNDEIEDFAYVPNDNNAELDLLMVGGKNLYVVQGVVPNVPYLETIVVERKNNPASLHITVAPNPFTYQITQTSKNIQPGNYTVGLYDQTGRLMLQKNMYMTNNTPALFTVPASLSKGVYMVKVENHTGTKTLKIVKQ